MKLLKVVLALLTLWPSVTFAHPGNTAADGCHYCRTNCDKWGVTWNERHCHGGYTAPTTGNDDWSYSTSSKPVYGTPGDPFDPVRSNKNAFEPDCHKSLGEGGEATGYGGCRCIASYHREGNECIPGAEGWTDPYADFFEKASGNTSSSVSEIKKNIFGDVASTHPYLPAIEWGKSSGVLKGYPDGTFRADNPVNRAEFLKIIIEADSAADVSTATEQILFPDVDDSAWFAPYVRYAKQHGIVDGYPDGTFRPDKTVNFAEALKIAYEALGINAEDVGGDWYARYLAHAKYNEALFTNQVDVSSNMTRKDVVWLVWRLSGMK